VYDFHRHIAVQDFVIRAIDNPHSPFPDLCHDTAMTEHLTYHEALPSRPMLGCFAEIRQ